MPHTTSFTLPAIRTEVSSLWKLAWPILIGQLATVGMGAADVAMTGHTNPEELAAVSLGAAIWSIVLVTVSGIMMAINTLVAHEIGAARHDRVPHIVRQSLWKALLVGLVACLLTNMAALVFDHLMLEPAVAAKAKLFVHIISCALPPFAAYRALYGYSTSINQTKPVMVIALAALGLNILVNYLLIYGHWGMPKMGGVGCAVATTCCVWMMLLAMLAWIRIAPAYRATYPFTHWEGPQLSSIGPMLRLGLPIGVTYFAEVSAFGVISLLVARFGVIQVSAHQIALNFSSVVFMVPLTFGIALVTRVGHAVGEANLRRARFISWVGVAMSLTAAIVSATLITVFRHQIAQAYTSDPQVQALCAQLLLFAALFQLSDATQVATSCAIRGYKVTRQPMLIQLLAFWGFSLPIGYVLGLAPSGFIWSPAEPMGAAGFWIGLVTGLTVAAVLLTWYLNRLSLQRLRTAR
ncbi:MATE family efflux transporter [Janthinobacterium lividum]|uniref:MATE family efflux transporter n=1 Tax=Janthinobacterium lividum TaxID=29581 RepID=UPI000874C873|nr:MATE family efflux transporter [Janthinobacterium lividum]MCC7714532.1 MATE family efflux transporter [Janthinobacterium lividum]OEZ55267.1 multidrug resistance protein NorM [Janthinobacterium lividum]WQE30266.1 MATE family efflux transporter [Janthinobacterium lividum]STQ95765.1 Na(+)/drug antiporter [Janthinobacterium lividum]